jgi:DNA topoisomerase I
LAKTTKKKKSYTAKKKTTRRGSNKEKLITKSQAKKTMSAKDNGSKKLIIVESPAKAKTINKYVGNKYEVVASGGHIIDLPKSRMGVDIKNGFKPEYITIRGKGNILSNLRNLSSFSKEVLLASDDDREGESISWHIKNAILDKNPDVKVKRIVFNEITKQAILNALKEPSDINQNKVEAQKARRILDRIVGYKLSPFLWEKIKKGLSAGRVQSVALRLICEREEEINNFIPEEYWKIYAQFKKGRSSAFKASLSELEYVNHQIKQEKFENNILKKLSAKDKNFLLECYKKQDKNNLYVRNAKLSKNDLTKIEELFKSARWHKKIEIISGKDASEVKQMLEKEKYLVSKIDVKERKRHPLPPYTTSKLQQDASNKFGYTGKKTMSIAQRLYMGVDLGKERTGLITYMRTDSTRISNMAMEQVRKYVGKDFGKKYLPQKPNYYKNKKGSQDAHECIRPTDINKTPDSVKKYLSNEEYKLYNLIWTRFVASQMEDAVYEKTQLDITSEKSLFKASSSKLIFEGFMKVFKVMPESDEKVKLPSLKAKDSLTLKEIITEQKFTEPNPRYNDASLVKKLEESGIGRPSTYAPIINTLITRYYIVRKQKQFIPTDIGNLTNKLLTENFDKIINVKFTAEMEEQLDLIEEEKVKWNKVLDQFYKEFENNVDKALKSVESFKGVLDEETDYVCEKCGRPMVKKLGKNGYFLACSGFPECRNAKPVPLGNCPKENCDGQIVRIKLPRKRAFYGCSNYPDCEFNTFDKPYIDKPCPECGSCLFEKRSKEKGSYLKCYRESCGWEGKRSDLKKNKTKK